jgi:hypothetical protein
MARRHHRKRQVLDRRRHPQKPPEPGEPLVKTVQDSLNQVDHQIWLLRNVAWWYLLPPGLAVAFELLAAGHG